MEGLLEEYKILKDEIQSNSDWTGKAFIFTLTVTTTIVGFGLSSDNWALFLCPFLIIIPAMFFVSSKMESTTRIGSYIRVVIEPQIKGLNWQSNWLKLREQELLPKKRKYSFSINGFFLGISILCFTLAWFMFFSLEYSLSDLFLITLLSIFIIVVFIFVYIEIKQSFGMKFRMNYDEAWSRLDSK